DDNRVTLDPEVKDAHSEPAARLTYAWTENDRKLVAAARDKGVEMMHASGARKVRTGLHYAAHAMGGCRMGDDPRTSVVNSLGRPPAAPNLFVRDPGVSVPSAGVTPTLTARALAARGAAHIAAAAKRGDV